MTFRSKIVHEISALGRRLAVFRFSTVCPLFGLALVLLLSPIARAQTVDLELVFAADGSGSIDDDELRLQREGYAAALSDSKVLAAIAAGGH